MTKDERIAALRVAMTRSTRENGEVFSLFSIFAPKGLVSLFLEHYEVRDRNYEIFSNACDMLVEIYNDQRQEKDGLDFVIDQIYERSSDSASAYTGERLTYLDASTQDEISLLVNASDDIATACAIWYDTQMEQAAIIINDWINAGDEIEGYD